MVDVTKKKMEQLCFDLPWCVEDEEKLGVCIEDFALVQESFYRRWTQKWFENFNFVYGNHNLKWSRRYDFAVDYDFLRKKDSPHGLASKTNIARTVAESLSAAIYGTMPTWECLPPDQGTVSSGRVAKGAEKILKYFAETQGLHQKFKSAASIYVVMSQVLFRTRWDNEGGGVRWVPKYRQVSAPVMTTVMVNDPISGGLIETQQPAVDSQGQAKWDKRWEPVTDPQGTQINEAKPLGGVVIDVLTPLQYRRDPTALNISDSAWIQTVDVIDYPEFVRRYRSEDGLIKKNFEDIEPGVENSKSFAFAIRHMFRMQYITPSVIQETQGRVADMSQTRLSMKNKVVVVEHWDKPDTKRWPFGRRVVVVNGKTILVSKPQYHTNALGGWHPFSEAQWWVCPPSPNASGPLNDTVEKNRELNVIDSLVATSMRRNLGSQLLVKIGSGLDPNKITGTPGEIHSVNSLDAAQWLHDSQPISPVVNMLRNNFKDDVYEVSGAQDSLRGDRSKGVSAGYALRQLTEREEKRITPARDTFEMTIADVGAKILACFRQSAKELGEDMIGYLKRNSAGEFTVEEIVGFMSQQVEQGVDVIVKKGSMMYESKATRQADLMELSKGPLGQRLSQDAEVLDKFIKFFDAETLRDQSGPHRDRAQRENDAFSDLIRLGIAAQSGVPTPVVIFEDDDNIHISKHTEWFIIHAEEVMKDETMLKIITAHLETHRIQDKAKRGEVDPATVQTVAVSQAQAGQQPPQPPQQVAQSNQMRTQQAMQQQAQQPAQQPAQQAMQQPQANTPAAKTAQAKQSQNQVEGTQNVAAKPAPTAG